MLTPILLATLINGIIFTSGWNKNRAPLKYTKLPPGWIIAIVWTVLLGLLGCVSYFVKDSILSFGIVCSLIVLCLLYPFYTRGLQDGKIMSYANSGVLLYSMCVIILLIYLETRINDNIYYIIVCLLPLIVWLSYVNAIDYNII